MKKTHIGALILTAIAVVLISQSFFAVPETQRALVLQFGKPVGEVRESGLNFKVPFIQDVVMIDKRLIDLDAPEQEIIASGQKRLVIDAFARYLIVDPLLFFQRIPNGSIVLANRQLERFVNSSVRLVLGEADLISIVRDRREELMAEVTRRVNQEAAVYGIEVVDVKIRQADLPRENSEAIYQRMRTERQQEASEIRAQGTEIAKGIVANAEREVAEITAEANRVAEVTLGKAEAQRTLILAEAYNRDPELFRFVRSLEAYRNSLKGTRFVMSPDSPFFEYFRNPDPGAVN